MSHLATDTVIIQTSCYMTFSSSLMYYYWL